MIILDIETTGFSNTDDEILQVSIIDGNNTVLFNEYMKPTHTERWDNAEAINGISPVMVKDEKPFEFYKEKINEIIKGADLVLGYNVIFDLGFLYENGDWKHEHLRIDSVIISALNPNKVSSVTIGENDSDCYSAIHTYVFN